MTGVRNFNDRPRSVWYKNVAWGIKVGKYRFYLVSILGTEKRCLGLILQTQVSFLCFQDLWQVGQMGQLSHQGCTMKIVSKSRFAHITTVKKFW
jgi:hypothetical protein